METNSLTLVRKRANKIFNQYSLSVPTDLAKIVAEKNFKVIYKENQLGIDGLCRFQNNQPIIEINTEITFIPRQRFTLAHEIGHICIPWHTGIDTGSIDDPSVIIDGKRQINTQELEANTFASELLMPTSWIQSNYDLIEFDLKELITGISNKAETSIMATLYALENALPSGHVYLVKTSSMEYWKPFKSKDSGTINVSIVNNISFYDAICIRKESFELSIYNIVHYELLPCPDLRSIQSIYEACDCDFVKFLNAISDFRPIHIIHFVDVILENITDKYYLILKMGDIFFRHIRSKDIAIRLYADYYDFDALVEFVEENYFDWGLLELGEDTQLLWIKDSVRYIESDDLLRIDPHELLKAITNDVYPDCLAHKMLLKVNGAVAAINGSNPKASREELYHRIKQRFETDPEYREIACHEQFNTYISNKISSLLDKRKLK